MRKDLLCLLREKCYRKGKFKLSSGKTSEHYINCKPVSLSGDGLRLISELFLEKITTTVVAGLTLGADPLVSGCAALGGIDALIVRKEPKGHGTGAWIEGPEFPKGTKVTVLEDVITTGGSSLKAVEKLRDAGYVVEQVLTIIDREEHESFTFYDAGLELGSLFKLSEISTS
tara:strand:+ start:1180 stop:1695 length:516 start_codon:yes stop_codon:yes gene_type:complete